MNIIKFCHLLYSWFIFNKTLRLFYLDGSEVPLRIHLPRMSSGSRELEQNNFFFFFLLAWRRLIIYGVMTADGLFPSTQSEHPRHPFPFTVGPVS